MTTSCDEPMGSRALASLTRLGQDGVEQPTEANLQEGLHALHVRIARGRVQRRRLVRWSAIGAVVLSVLVLVQVAVLSRTRWSVPEPQALTYRIEGGSVLEGGYLRESGHGGIKLTFNEGSELVLASGTRGRLRTVDEQGARVAIENGTAHFQVTHDGDRRWLVEVGPFLVTVKGTVFTVSWDPQRERFELTLQRGLVEVSGPVSAGRLELRSGQRLVVDLTKAETWITENGLDQAVAPSSAVPAPSAAGSVMAGETPAGTSASAGPASSSGSKPRPARRWADELASGNWDRILEDVERAGVDATLNQASSDELFALADAARYRRRPDLARAALLAQRRRFPGSVRTLFLLGRVEEARGSGMPQAIAWYDEYLARAPSGAYAAEALGRKMTITSEAGGPAKARPIAEEYLRRFPKGTYAGSARAILRVP